MENFKLYVITLEYVILGDQRIVLRDTIIDSMGTLNVVGYLR